MSSDEKEKVQRGWARLMEVDAARGDEGGTVGRRAGGAG
jgi:hypothetical protein